MVIRSQQREINTSQKIIQYFQLKDNEHMLKDFQKLQKLNLTSSILSITRQWITICLAIFFAINFDTWPAYSIAILIIATRQHALGIIAHEATHYRLLPSKTANDFIGDLFCAIPINMMVSRYRTEHLLHHKYNMSPQDPYYQEWIKDSHWHWPKTKANTILLFIKDVLGLNMPRLAPTLMRWSPWSNHFSTKETPTALTNAERTRLYGFFFLLIGCFLITNFWLYFLLLWVLPLSTFTVFFMRIRSVGEHLNLKGKTTFTNTRHVNATFLEKLTVAPLNINIHIAHHLFQNVPQYHLKDLHHLLLQYPEYQESPCLYDSYFAVGKQVYKDLTY